MADAKNIGALWKKEKNGKTFLSGTIEIGAIKVKVCVFKNDRKDKETSPDYRIVTFDVLQPTESPTAPKKAMSEEESLDNLASEF